MATALATIGAATPAHAAPAEPDAIHTWRGDQPNERFGWAVSQLGDIDRDGVQEAIIGAARHADDQGRVNGHTDVRSGRTGKLLHRFTGAPDDVHGYAMADAGDVNRDGVPDIVVGATGEARLACFDTPRPGRIYVYSGRTGRELLTVDGETDGDQFGAAVGAAGDVDRDGRADLLVGAPCHDGPAGADAGRAYVVSGRTGRVLRTHDGAEAGDALGWGAAGLGDVTGDRRADYIVGAKDAGPGDRGLAYVYDGRRGTTRFTLAGDEQVVRLRLVLRRHRRPGRRGPRPGHLRRRLLRRGRHRPVRATGRAGVRVLRPHRRAAAPVPRRAAQRRRRTGPLGR